VLKWESAIVIDRKGTLRAVQPGYHRRKLREKWHILDLRPVWLSIAPQEVLSADSLQLRVTPVIRYQVTDAALWLTGTQESANSLYVLAQLALREVIAAKTLDELVIQRSTLLTDARAQLATKVEALGAEILEFEVRDLTLPSELRTALSETALAKEQGRARLERARSEAAALRSLANTAQLLEAHPSLLELRAIEAAGTSGQFIVRIGNTGENVGTLG
jgi:regulator of protease activity HflC (stomatin/prohibitin superfamily)